jgi:riboflavin biosynthesis pyrimidine reductase
VLASRSEWGEHGMRPNRAPIRNPPPSRTTRTPVAPPRLSPFENLWDRAPGRLVPLPPGLARLYGSLRLPDRGARAHVIANFASTLDGVVALGGPGPSSGGEITNFDPHDRMLMGLLRALADVVIVGAGTFRAVPRHIWTAPHVDPARSTAYVRLRETLGKPRVPRNVVVTESGRLDLGLPLFTRGEVPVLIVTTRAGRRRLGGAEALPSVDVEAVRRSGPVRADDVLEAVRACGASDLILVEGGPHLVGSFFAERRIDELFLTVVPQVGGRDGAADRLGLVEGRTFAPTDPRWGTLTGVRRGGDLLFLRFGFPGPGSQGAAATHSPARTARRAA